MLGEKSPALENGTTIHLEAEQFLTGEATAVPLSLIKFEDELTRIKTKELKVEEAICLDRHWQPVKSKDAWEDPKTWIRARTDMRVGNFIVDLKTGRSYPKYREQASLYATMLFQQFPQFHELDFEFWYTRTGDVEQHVFTRAGQQDRLASWDARANLLMMEKIWAPKRNSACRFCTVQDHCPFFGGNL